MGTTVENAWCVGIRAKYIGPGNVRGSRWRVWRADEKWTGDPDRLEVPYFHEVNSGADNAARAIVAYLERKGDSWKGQWFVACGSDDSYVGVKVPAGRLAVRSHRCDETPCTHLVQMTDA